MKKLLLLILFLVVWVSSSLAQQVEISGTQQRFPGRNAELSSVKVKISKTMTIVSVTGNNNGFWIMKNEMLDIFQAQIRKIRKIPNRHLEREESI